MEESLSLFWWSSDHSKVCSNLSTCLCYFLIQSERFGCLFDLAETKSRTVAKMYALGWDGEGETWVWRRQLRVLEKEML
jgi:hypothetical protein